MPSSALNSIARLRRLAAVLEDGDDDARWLPEPDFTPGERDIAAMAAGNVAEIDSPRLGNGPTGATRPLDAPDYLSVEDGAQRANIHASESAP